MDRWQWAWAVLCSFVLFGVQSSNLSAAAAFEFRVGDAKGWSVPSGTNQTNFYDQWAGRNRFQVGDTLLFKYNRSSDSVVQVNTVEEYRSCNTSKSVKRFTDGNTVFKLERPGAFYFITGSSGNCKRGLKMILVVMSQRHGTGGRAAPAPSPSMILAPRPQLAPAPRPFYGNSPAPAPSIASSPTPSIEFRGPAKAPNAYSPSPTPSYPPSQSPSVSPLSPPAPPIASSPTPSIGSGGPERAPNAYSPSQAPTASPPSPSEKTSPPPSQQSDKSPAPSPGAGESSASAASAPNLLTSLLCAGIGLLGLLVFT